MIVKRECDIPMARSKKLLPCDKDCKKCMACIETTSAGERRHCTRHKNSNLALDIRLAQAGLEPEPRKESDPEAGNQKRARKKWTDMETKRLRFLKEQGKTWSQIAEQLQRTRSSVQARYHLLTAQEKQKTS